MSTSAPPVPLHTAMVPPLEAGDHLDQATFHSRYEAMPKSVRAELIAGQVYMPSPLKVPHAELHPRVMTWLTLYVAETPATRAFDNATVILGFDSEPQPDGCLLLRPENGGQARENQEGYIVGAPELVVEVASSSEAYDLHTKLQDYERYGVQEYLVLVLRTQQAEWYVRQDERLVRLAPDADRILRSPRFGGLWLDAEALFNGDVAQVTRVLQAGLASDAHKALCGRLS